MSVGERDPFTGHMTTGHEWNGITELNTPVPRVVILSLIITAALGLVWTVLMPSWPFVTSYFPGVLGIDQRNVVANSVAEAQAERSPWMSSIEDQDFSAILSNPELMRIVRENGRTLFGDNCAACHGHDAKGQRGFPNIAQSPMLWGDSPEAILQTITVGINSTDPNTRVSQMLAFGRDGTLTPPQISQVTSYVQSLSATGSAAPLDKDQVEQGKAVFAANCVACHGKDAKGLTDMGAPNLTDSYWIYGGERQDMYGSIYHGRQGHMPNWGARLSPAAIKILTLYVLDMRKQAVGAGS
ncbi:cytochrome-c oxidase, cbb3-type subunit III [Phyllobacterium brassicacearum]|uniref:Cbb3-type cytochrome c oxidase subunit n=1 Tax=Phyllobacterium brassicacearum TaxID=314235 RepID=A0A2P7BP46_9HYPH|nr:cytochrome-c oxidase, cbb3-type subunit III [Phyllobacterium brassicacearum]PSH68232.1 cytochrome-c oxidase, cbb3-type subunit III [Phyllobacterium brassicacearum]TDQ29522.1 cytochrome c oxidase cbb3-type subunit 3 [Phyllobacterium brassicacearum]